jgi:hypothetical protein
MKINLRIDGVLEWLACHKHRKQLSGIASGKELEWGNIFKDTRFKNYKMRRDLGFLSIINLLVDNPMCYCKKERHSLRANLILNKKDEALDISSV